MIMRFLSLPGIPVFRNVIIFHPTFRILRYFKVIKQYLSFVYLKFQARKFPLLQKFNLPGILQVTLILSLRINVNRLCYLCVSNIHLCRITKISKIGSMLLIYLVFLDVKCDNIWDPCHPFNQAVTLIKFTWKYEQYMIWKASERSSQISRRQDSLHDRVVKFKENEPASRYRMQNGIFTELESKFVSP